MDNGFVFSFEAVLSLLLLASIILMQAPAEETGLHKLAVFQKENDLLKVWAKQQKFSLQGMKKDFEFAFPGKSGELFVNAEKIVVGQRTEKAVSSQMQFFSANLERIVVKITVFE